MTRDTPQRRILDTFGAADEITGIDIDYSLADLKLFVPAFAVALLWFALLTSVGGIVATAIGITGGVSALAGTAIVVFIAPTHMTPQTWLKQILTFTRRPKLLTLFASTANERTEPLTRVSSFRPKTDSLERVDSALVTGVSIEPANLTLATDAEWNAAANALGNALNTLEFDFQIRSTARHVDADELVSGYTDRLDDPDVRANETLRRLIECYRQRLPSEFQARGTSVRNYQILIPVTVHEVQLAERGALAKLAEVPYFGGLFAFLGAESTRMTAAEIRTAQGQLLAKRLRAVQNAIRGIETCQAEPIAADTLAEWVEEFWTGTRTKYGTDGSRLRTTPVVAARTTAARESAPETDTDLNAESTSDHLQEPIQ
ncbi:hypothetical protein [Haladaptatus sp. DFWS20]|uniref:hypothetical protein n=1 Tax=Haladaptatus sp. DFWS20 TaxID=3403467 RepID=UPI003EC075AF